MYPDPGGLNEIVRSLGERGFVEGRQLEVVRVVIPGAPSDALDNFVKHLAPTIEREVLALKPDVILTLGSRMAKGTHLATRTIPIVVSVSDPVDLGLAASLARPGGNVTGLAQGLAETSVKTMEMMKLIVPRLARVAIFHDPRPLAVRGAGHYERAAKSVGLEPVMLTSMDPAELVRLLRSVPAMRIQAGFWASGAGEEEEIAREAIAARVPLFGTQEPFVEVGLLASYEAFDPVPSARLAAIVEQILRGTDPGTIPFQFPRQFRLVINRRTASALKLAVPPDLLLRADRVID
jgi:putative ABC transport system substrate-binding protein